MNTAPGYVTRGALRQSIGYEPSETPDLVHRWWTTPCATKDAYEVFVVRYEMVEVGNGMSLSGQTWSLTPDALWRPTPQYGLLTPWVTIPGSDLNPHLGRPDWRLAVAASVATRVGPRLQELADAAGWRGRTSG